MTYRGSLPHGHGSGFNGQQNQSPNQYPQALNNGYDAWGNPQFQQYQNTVFHPITYPNQPPQQLHYQQPHNVHQPIQPQNANYQFQSYDPSFDQRPLQPSPQHNVNASGQAMHAMHQPIQQAPNQHRYGQQMDWQHMPPPMSMPMPSPSPSYHLPAPQSTPQRQQSMPQHVNSPVAAQSPQIPPQVVHNVNNRNVNANARMEHANRVSASPRLTTQGITRSPSVSSTRSPAPTPGLIPHHADTNSLLICVAEEYFEKARKESLTIADSLDAQRLHEYQKLIATGLGCLEVVLDNTKLAPRLEARIRLRYASILCEETNNIMEAETALTKGITLCERNRFADLKYLMHFLQIKLLFSQQKAKAAMIALEGRIRDAEVMKHSHWIYAFRFLKASLYLQSANPSEAHALENLKAITSLASQRGDRAIFVVASLLEGLSLLKTMRDDAIVRIQACIAQAMKYQLEDSTHIPQLDVLALMLDLACSLHQKSVQTIARKLNDLQARMDASLQDTSWGLLNNELLLPIRKQPSNVPVISNDTSAILRPGVEGDPCDYLAMSFWSKFEAFTVTYTYSGLALLYQTPRNDKRIFQLWEEALAQLYNTGIRLRGWPHSLENAISNADWQREMKCYLYILQGLHFAAFTRWADVRHCVVQLESTVKPPLEGSVVLYSTYLAGVYRQGTGDLNAANAIFSNRIFSLDTDETRNGRRRPVEIDVSLLAAFNRIWIMQHPDHRNDRLTRELLEQLQPLCTDHPNLEIRTAYNLVLAAVQTNPPISMTSVKMHLTTALNNAQTLGNVQTLSIALNLMRAKLFQSIVGDQALKSAKAASNQAKKSGNTLWMSVADGMLAQSYDVQGQAANAQKALGNAIAYARQAFDTERRKKE
ncbi:cohesin loading factor-domain-containing protein [Xylariaceae sp. FL0662B]|nr:cohesin loading factor-domain-containing protein [Xylariaceae sp. FL0662B]